MSVQPTLRVAADIGSTLVVAWAGFVGLAWCAMSQGPDAIGRFMAGVPAPAFRVLPFGTVWSRTRAGRLQVGDRAPDFDLPTADGTARVRLSQFRDQRPVVLIPGSST